jgi:AcrR family transcriptional regulator
MGNPTATKRALLDAGRAEFANHGLAGARTARIAASAKVNKERIYAYFGNKEGLFAAVMDDALEDLLDLVPMPPPGPDPLAMVRAYVDGVARYHQEHPELMRLVQWESLERSRQPIAGSVRSSRYRAKVSGLAARLGITEADAAPLLIQMVLLAAGPMAIQNLAAMLLSDARPQALDQVRESNVAAAVCLVSAAVARSRARAAQED